MFANYDDGDGNGIVNFADGFDLPEDVLNAAIAAGIDPADTVDDGETQSFTPIVIEVSQELDLSQVKLRLTYTASDPRNVTFSDGEFVADPSGNIRIWAKDGYETRTSTDPTEGGDFIAPDVDYDWTQIQAAQSSGQESHTITLFIEGIAPSGYPG